MFYQTRFDQLVQPDTVGTDQQSDPVWSTYTLLGFLRNSRTSCILDIDKPNFLQLVQENRPVRCSTNKD